VIDFMDVTRAGKFMFQVLRISSISEGAFTQAGNRGGRKQIQPVVTLESLETIESKEKMRTEKGYPKNRKKSKKQEDLYGKIKQKEKDEPVGSIEVQSKQKKNESILMREEGRGEKSVLLSKLWTDESVSIFQTYGICSAVSVQPIQTTELKTDTVDEAVKNGRIAAEQLLRKKIENQKETGSLSKEVNAVVGVNECVTIEGSHVIVMVFGTISRITKV